jgi:hypothetical protein
MSLFLNLVQLTPGRLIDNEKQNSTACEIETAGQQNEVGASGLQRICLIAEPLQRLHAISLVRLEKINQKSSSISRYPACAQFPI